METKNARGSLIRKPRRRRPTGSSRPRQSRLEFRDMACHLLNSHTASCARRSSSKTITQPRQPGHSVFRKKCRDSHFAVRALRSTIPRLWLFPLSSEQTRVHGTATPAQNPRLTAGWTPSLKVRVRDQRSAFQPPSSDTENTASRSQKTRMRSAKVYSISSACGNSAVFEKPLNFSEQTHRWFSGKINGCQSRGRFSSGD